jgi:acyl transferase domain-containing protein
MEPLREGLAEALQHISPKAPQLPYMSGARGDWVSRAADVGLEHWWLHCRAPVEFRRAIEGLKAAGHQTLVEFGPRSLFSNLPPSDRLRILRAQDMADQAFA